MLDGETARTSWVACDVGGDGSKEIKDAGSKNIKLNWGSKKSSNEGLGFRILGFQGFRVGSFRVLGLRFQGLGFGSELLILIQLL